jgi:pseudouridine-5'-monophosphatase
LVALQAIDDTLEEGEEKIKPEECLIFEDGLPGVVAERRVGMRVPYPGLTLECKGGRRRLWQGEEKARRMGMDWGLLGMGWESNW